MKQGFVNIRGKEYKTVALRVHEFREQFKDHCLTTDIIKLDDDQCLIKASVIKDGVVIATGHAHEWRNSSQINGTSYVENCETSAIGRALSSLGIGGAEFASAEEVANAIHQQNSDKSVPAPNESGLSVGNADFMVCKESTQKYLKYLAEESRPLLGDVGKFLNFTGTKLEEKFGNNANDATLISAFYSLLDAKERAAIKKYQLQQREAA